MAEEKAQQAIPPNCPNTRTKHRSVPLPFDERNHAPSFVLSNFFSSTLNHNSPCLDRSFESQDAAVAIETWGQRYRFFHTSRKAAQMDFLSPPYCKCP